MVRLVAGLVLLAPWLGVSGVSAVGHRNPDTPFGGVAVDFQGSVTLGEIHRSLWDLVQFVDAPGGGFLADGLTVDSDGDIEVVTLGVSVMKALSPHVTAQIDYRYSDRDITDVRFRKAGAVSNLRLGDLYEEQGSSHSLGLRIRRWFGTREGVRP